jgi:nitrate reductase delta subunit
MARVKTHTNQIAEAAEWRLTGLLLERPRRSWHEEIARLGRELQDPQLRAAVAAARTATEGEYLRRLGPAGLVSPREVAYRPFADPGQLLAQLSTVYAAFAFRPHVEEPIDHIAVEVAFVGYLLLKEAFAAARDDRTAAATTAAARRGFIETHLAGFAGELAQRLQNVGASYLLATARALAGRVPASLPAGSVPRAGNALAVCDACAIGESC